MGEKTGNYVAGIHNADYEGEYQKILLDHNCLINISGRETESLNGKWHFCVDPYDTCRRARWFREVRRNDTGAEHPVDWDFDWWERTPVPGTWNVQKRELFWYEGSGIYMRTFRYVPKQMEERAFLYFEGAAYEASVFLNGVFIGTHDGGSTPFTVEISDTVQTDRENRLIVVADARRSPLRVPMDNTDWFNYGGLYREVHLVRVPNVYIKDWFVRLVPDGTFSAIRADIAISGAGVGGKTVFAIPELGIEEEITLRQGAGRGVFAVDAKSLSLWEPENPKLYDVSIRLFPEGGGAGADLVRDRAGFREIKTKGQEILLNGKKIFLKGVSVHEDHVLLGKTTTPDIIRGTIRDLKEMNGNYLRLAHYPHDRRFAQIADEEGVLLWEEIPVYWAIAFGNKNTYRDAENQLAELIQRDRNRASVIIWSVGNENADTEERLKFMSSLSKKARELDETRLVSAACLVNHAKLKIEDRLSEFLDVIGVNEYYGWYDPDFDKLSAILSASKPDKPVIVTEFGGGARSGQRGGVYDLFSEDYQKALYIKQVETFKKYPFIAGLSPWILYDFRCPRRFNRHQEGYNRKGLIDADRKTRKLAFFVMQAFYKER
ncbi:MAG: beta galactosidase jelly roll domain-containing protein [Treponema sp.]|jgi:beta-glucuronidase|nr:beta galactosidase jelly roll domain-containing protein [Treponema sp.]